MHELSIYPKYFSKIALTIKTLTAKPVGKAILIPVVAAPVYTITEKTLILLAALFVMDFITGVMASYVEFKKALPVTPGAGKRYVFSSAKMRLSAVKFVTYAMGVICAYGIESIFLIKEFDPGHLTTQKLTLTTIVTLFFCVIEAYSIFFENIKRMGYDIIQKVKNISSTGWGVYKAVKGENKNEES